MPLRDELESILRAWNRYELARGAPAVIDFDCHPQPASSINGPLDRLSAYWQLLKIHQAATETDNTPLAERVNAHLTYLRALMGERLPLDEYVSATQGCHANGWPDPYIRQIGETTRSCLDAVGVRWDANTRDELANIEQAIDPQDAPDAIEQAARDLEPTVRQATGSSAPYRLTVESTQLNVYWAYWTDGVGQDVRVRLNMKQAQFTEVQARQFALHEVLGHGLQGASYAQRCTTEPVPWVRILSVHTQQQVLLEGLAQALPLFVTPDDKLLVARVRLDHYTQLVRANLHVALALAHQSIPVPNTPRLTSPTGPTKTSPTYSQTAEQIRCSAPTSGPIPLASTGSYNSPMLTLPAQRTYSAPPTETLSRQAS